MDHYVHGDRVETKRPYRYGYYIRLLCLIPSQLLRPIRTVVLERHKFQLHQEVAVVVLRLVCLGSPS